MMKRFSNRTLLLMVLALAAFGNFWWRMHQRRPVQQREPAVIHLVPPAGPSSEDAGARAE